MSMFGSLSVIDFFKHLIDFCLEEIFRVDGKTDFGKTINRTY